MDIHSRYNEIIRVVVSRLRGVSNAATFATVSNGRDVADTTMMLKRLVYDAMAESDFCFAKDVYYLFTGEIYEPIDRDLLGKSVEEWLMSMNVSPRILYYSMRKIVDEAMLSIRINKPFQPSFHVRAYLNGVVDFTDGELRPFGARHHVVYKNPYEYDPSARCPMWQHFLRTVLPERESRLILQMYLGLCTYDRGSMVDKVENCLMLYGTGANGKSVIFETIQGIFGWENVSTMGLLSLIKGGDERLRNMARVDGKVVNVCPEIQARDISGSEDAFKALCSGERQYGRNIGGNVFEIRNVPWLIFNMNNLPRASDGSYGFFRRFLYVIFENVIPEERQNKHLSYDLVQEYPGILNWIRRGGEYLRRRKFIFPRSDNSERQKLLAMGEINPVMSWAIARGVRPHSGARGEISAWISSALMHEDLMIYCEMNGFAKVDTQAFGKRMTSLGFGKTSRKRKADGIYYNVFGCTEEVFAKTVPPLVAEMDMSLGEEDVGDIDPEDV